MKKLHLTGLLLIATILSLSMGDYSAESQVPPDAHLSNIVFTPNSSTVAVVHVGSEQFITPTANSNGQSPFLPADPGTYDIRIESPDGFTLVQAFCNFQEPNGNMVAIGSFDGVDTVNGVLLTANVAHLCTWIFEEDDSLEENINQIAVQIERSSQSIEQIKSNINSLEAEISQLEDEKAQLQEQIDNAKAELTRLQELLASL